MVGTLSLQAAYETIQSGSVGRIGCFDGDKIYVVPVHYVADGKNVLINSVEGKKIQIMRLHPDVCFQVDQIQDYNHWKSVIAWGKYYEIKQEHERYHAIKLFIQSDIHIKAIDKGLLPELTAEHILPNQDGHVRPVIYRIILEEVTGRFEND